MGAEGSWEGGRGRGVKPTGFQRAIGSLHIPWGHRRFLSSLAWKLYEASHLWLRPSFPRLLPFQLSQPGSARSPAASLSCRLLSPPTKANPEGTHRLFASLCLLLSLLLLLRDLSSFASTLWTKSHIPGGTAEPHGAGTGMLQGPCAAGSQACAGRRQGAG